MYGLYKETFFTPPRDYYIALDWKLGIYVFPAGQNYDSKLGFKAVDLGYKKK